jgi:hypothetical protein
MHNDELPNLYTTTDITKGKAIPVTGDEGP